MGPELNVDLQPQMASRSAMALMEPLFANLTWRQDYLADHGLDEALFAKGRRQFRKHLRTTASGAMLQQLRADPAAFEQAFLEYVSSRHARRLQELKELVSVSDLRSPEIHYTLARAMQRRIVFHAGPTNSGKTFDALQALISLKASQRGIYCAPLRLLALEVFDKINAVGRAAVAADGSASAISADLLTGEERRQREGARVLSCTVEMAPLHSAFDVAVIDEIQMLGDEKRGWAFTRALLGLPAAQIHLCGEARALSLVRRLLESCSPEEASMLEVRTYERLTPCEPELHSLLGDLRRVQPGDAVIAFSRRDIFRLKLSIEQQTGLDCAVVYGNLPPQVRSAQAQRFNAGTEASVLVASDAIAMGLNMSIGRIVFSTMKKFNGSEVTSLERPLIRQISGRAGRFGSRFPHGRVTCLVEGDMKQLLAALREMSIPPLQRAGIKPSFEQIAEFQALLPQSTPFSEVLEKFVDLVMLDSRQYFVCDFEDEKAIAAALEPIDASLMSSSDRYTFCCAPVDSKNERLLETLLNFAAAHANGQTVHVRLSLPHLSGCRSPTSAVAAVGSLSPLDLREMETIHSALDLYIWLSYRFPQTFIQRDQAALLRDACREIIEMGLESSSSSSSTAGSASALRRRRSAIVFVPEAAFTVY